MMVKQFGKFTKISLNSVHKIVGFYGFVNYISIQLFFSVNKTKTKMSPAFQLILQNAANTMLFKLVWYKIDFSLFKHLFSNTN